MVRIARISKYIALFLLVLVAIPAVYAESPSLSLDVNPKSGTIDDHFIFSVSVTGAAETEYPILAGGDEFTVDLIGPESTVQVINGEISRSITFRYRLTPQKTGTFNTPSVSLNVDGQRLKQDGIPVQVGDAVAPDPLSDEPKDLFAKQSVSKEKVYVGEQIVNSLVAFSQPRPFEFSVDSFAYDGFWTQDLGKIEKGQTTVKGERYMTIRVRKALFPLRSGAFTLPSRKVLLKVRDRERSRRSPLDLFGMDPFSDSFFEQAFGGVLTERAVRSNESKIEVLPLPPIPDRLNRRDIINPSPTIVGATSLSVKFPAGEINYGESKTIEVTIRSEGNINPLSSLGLLESSDLKVYEESPQTSQYEVAGKLVTEKVFKVSLVPQVGGSISIESPKLLFFNPESAEYDVAQGEKITFNVRGGPAPTEKVDREVRERDSGGEPKEQANINDSHSEPQLTYEEEGSLSRALKVISPTLLFFIVAVVSLAIFVGRLLFKIRAKRVNLNGMRSRISSASSVSELSSEFRAVLKEILNEDVSSLSSEELKALVKRRDLDQNLLFRVQSTLDQIDLLLFSGKATSESELSKLKTKILELVK